MDAAFREAGIGHPCKTCPVEGSLAKGLKSFQEAGCFSVVKRFMSNVIRWLLFWMPIRLVSKKVSPLVSVSSNHRYDIIKSTTLRIIENNGAKFHEIEVPVVIIDVVFGRKDTIGRFYLPLNARCYVWSWKRTPRITTSPLAWNTISQILESEVPTQGLRLGQMNIDRGLSSKVEI